MLLSLGVLIRFCYVNFFVFYIGFDRLDRVRGWGYKIGWVWKRKGERSVVEESKR